MDRKKSLNEIKQKERVWDVVVIGGGSSGLGIALDALSRGLSVVLAEKADFAKGTSSRSTKLLHGGVRYLAQGDVFLVLEALKERGLTMKNAPHVSRRQSFIIPLYSRWDQLKYGIGLKVYDLMAGRLRIGSSRILSREKALQKLPTLKKDGLLGGVVYYDGQFDDARLAVNVAQTCAEMGGCILNYAEVTGLKKDDKGMVNGIELRDHIHEDTYEVKARVVANATGVFADEILHMDNPRARQTILPSQGIHLTLDLSFLGGRDALMIPETSDGRVLFGIPWHNKLILGTTDTLRKEPELEPEALEKEIDFILETCESYLTKPPTRKDVLSVFAGLRPLAAPKAEGAKTKEVSRSHKIVVSDSELVSLIGGKWTTYRRMGQDTVDTLVKLKGLKAGKSTSENIRLHGYQEGSSQNGPLSIYGSDAEGIRGLISKRPELEEKLHLRYPYTRAEVVWMVQEEMAMKVEDVLARRLRILFLDAQAAMEMAPAVAEIMGEELGNGADWRQSETEAFRQLAQNYLIDNKQS